MKTMILAAIIGMGLNVGNTCTEYVEARNHAHEKEMEIVSQFEENRMNKITKEWPDIEIINDDGCRIIIETEEAELE